jgi:hypothetical protein
MLARKTKIAVGLGPAENLALFLLSFPLAGQSEQVLGHGGERTVLFLLLVVGLGLLAAILGLILIVVLFVFERRFATRKQVARKPKEPQAVHSAEARELIEREQT